MEELVSILTNSIIHFNAYYTTPTGVLEMDKRIRLEVEEI